MRRKPALRFEHRYLPATAEDEREMLQAVGVDSIEALFADIPDAIRFRGRLNVSEALSEEALLLHLRQLAERNNSLDRLISFLGAGMYDHFIPTVVRHLLSRSEFYTSYT